MIVTKYFQLCRYVTLDTELLEDATGALSLVGYFFSEVNYENIRPLLLHKIKLSNFILQAMCLYLYIWLQ